MKILEILQSEESGTEKLDAVKTLVEAVRRAYGNEDLKITEEQVSTAEGYMSLSLLSVDEKVAVAISAIKVAISNATARVELEEGTVFDREFERLIAKDALLTNLGAESDSVY